MLVGDEYEDAIRLEKPATTKTGVSKEHTKLGTADKAAARTLLLLGAVPWLEPFRFSPSSHQWQRLCAGLVLGSSQICPVRRFHVFPNSLNAEIPGLYRILPRTFYFFIFIYFYLF